LGIAAINTGNNLIYLILAALLGILAVSGFFGKKNLMTVRVDVKIPDEIYAGIPAPVSVVAKNPGRYFPVFLIRAYVGGTRVLFPYVRAGTTEQRFIEIAFPQRGEQKMEEVRIASVYPFSFFVRYRTVRLQTELTVFPHPVSFTDAVRTDLNRQLRGDHPEERPGYDGDILSIRNYLTGDSVRYINWKASARSGSLKTNELSAGLTEPLIIEFEKIMIPDLELKLSCLTSFIINQFRKNRAIGLKLGGRYFPPAATQAHKLHLLRELAGYGQGPVNHAR
jgi:uncharacterized protein (DUF58 family)